MRQSPAMLAIFERVIEAAGSPVPVLIEGETGTGKKLVAREIRRSARLLAARKGAFVAVDLGAEDPNPAASTLLGHRKGAFTSPHNHRPGAFELASGGTILTCLVISIPPLRDRMEDLEVLVPRLLERIAAEVRRAQPPLLDEEAWERLRDHHWPGNVRELEHCLKGTFVRSPSGAILADDLEIHPLAPRAAAGPVGGNPAGVGESGAEIAAGTNVEVPGSPADLDDLADPARWLTPAGRPLTWNEGQRAHIQAVLGLADENVSEAARLLGVTRPTGYSATRFVPRNTARRCGPGGALSSRGQVRGCPLVDTYVHRRTPSVHMWIPARARREPSQPGRVPVTPFLRAGYGVPKLGLSLVWQGVAIHGTSLERIWGSRGGRNVASEIPVRATAPR